MSCPKCGSGDVMLLPSNEFACKHCGHKWPIPQVDYSWVEVEVKKARLFERYIDAPIETCERLLAELAKELNERDARILAAKILLMRAYRRRLSQSELQRLHAEADKCFQ
ncbi:MAG: TFIIB-type zinc ribbon-containing protein [Thermoproteaceae archaeon]|jgi:predicted nucleic acid-binding Zn ribbon protein|nr:TFIIB-type zinc ribbon-containing protein [Thermoproteaceae archaeon]